MQLEAEKQAQETNKSNVEQLLVSMKDTLMPTVCIVIISHGWIDAYIYILSHIDLLHTFELSW